MVYGRRPYLAGLIDGEGYIGIKKQRRKDCVNPLYHERVQVRMVHEEAIRLLRDTLGGNYYREKPHAHNGRPLYCWQASDLLAVHVLRQVLPWLIVKRENAENVLLLRASKQRTDGREWRTLRPEVIEEREAIYLRAKALNH